MKERGPYKHVRGGGSGRHEKARERNAIGQIARGREREREKKRTRSLLPLEKKSILGKSGDG